MRVTDPLDIDPSLARGWAETALQVFLDGIEGEEVDEAGRIARFLAEGTPWGLPAS